MNRHPSKRRLLLKLYPFISYIYQQTNKMYQSTHKEMDKYYETLFPLESCPQVSDEAFHRFHTIDRQLYTRLIQNLGRDPAESVQVMAFWIWLERENSNSNLIRRMLSLPPLLLNELADETTACLVCVESDNFLFGVGNDITLLPEILNSPVVSLGFFHEHRIAVLRSVSKIINTVCVRAFSDILERVWSGNNAAARGKAAWYLGGNQEIGESSRVIGGAPPPIMLNPYVDVPPLVPLHPIPAPAVGIQMSDLAADDRTVFLTFSKGYPTSEDEVREFFSKRFGNFIEDVIMQEVGEDEQVLYARMVAKGKSAGVVDEIVGGNKAKYSINGKHVWARRYVKKSPHQS